MRTKEEFREWFNNNAPNEVEDGVWEWGWVGYMLGQEEHELEEYKKWRQLKLFDDGSSQINGRNH